jgi:lipopolysaccharide exporter
MVDVEATSPTETPVDAAYRRERLDTHLARGVLWTGAIKWAIQLVSWPVTIATTHYLSPADFGYLALLGPIARFVQLFTEAGLGSAIVNGMPVSPSQERQLQSVSTLAGLVGALVLVLLAWPVAYVYHDQSVRPVLMVLALTLLLEGLSVVPASIMRRQLDFKRLAMVEAARNLADIAVTLALAFAGARYWSLVFGYLAGLTVWCVAITWLRPTRFQRPVSSELTAVGRFAKQSIGRGVSGMLAYSSDAPLGGLSLPKSSLGLYSFAFTIAFAPADKVTQLILRVVPAVLGSVRESREELARYLLSITSVIALIAFPMFVGLAIVAGDVVAAFLGKEWGGVESVIIPLCAFGLVTETMSVIPHILLTRGETRIINRMAFAALLVMPPLFWGFARFFGPVGLAAAWPVGSLLLAIPPARVALRSVGVSPWQFLRSIRTPAMGCVVMFVALALLAKVPVVSQLQPLPRLGIRVVLGAVTYFTSVFLLDRSRIRALYAMVRALRAKQQVQGEPDRTANAVTA